MSRVDISVDRTRAEELFAYPEQVQAHIDKMKHEVSLPRARTAYLDFQPPVINAGTHPNARNDRRNHKRNYRKKQTSQFVFDLNAVTKSQATPALGAPPSVTAGRSTVDTSTVTTAQAESMSSEEATAKAAAAKAITAANALLQRYPSKGKSAHQGMYDTIADKYGNLVPVVVVDGKWVVLTEKTLIQSRKQAQPRNFGIARVVPMARRIGTKTTATITDGKGGKSEKDNRKRWGDEDSSEDEWAKNINASFQHMETDTEDGQMTPDIVETSIEEVARSSAAEQALDDAIQDTSLDVVMEEANNDPPARKAYFSVDQTSKEGSKKGKTYVEAVAKQLFNAVQVVPETGLQSSPSDPTTVQEQAQSETIKLTVLHSKRSSIPEESPTEWQTVAEKKQKGRNKAKPKEKVGQTRETSTHVQKHPVADAKAIDDKSDLIARLEAQNASLAQKNAELAQMMEQNNKLLHDLSLSNSTLTAAMKELAQSNESARNAVTRQTLPEPKGSQAQQEAKTPDKKRTSKKTSLELVQERTPPKPPEGTPQRTKKKRVSESPASTKSNKNTNRFSPLQQGEQTKDNDSSADADEEPNELAPTEETGDESAVANGPKAPATNPHQVNNSPGSGSNGVGRAE